MPVLTDFCVRPFASLPEFERTVGPFLSTTEVENNLLISLVQLLRGPNFEVGEPDYRAVLDGNTVVGAALRTGRERALVLSSLPNEAVPLVCDHVWSTVSGLEAIVGPSSVVERFLEFSRRPSRIVRRMEGYFADNICDPPPTYGRFRIADVSDLDQLVEWDQLFEVEAHASPPSPSARDRVKGIVEKGRYFVWDDGGPVCQVCATPPGPHGGRIANVFTPKTRRGRGYASNCSAATARHLLGQGYRYVSLFADCANPTSNAIYRKIGFRPFGTFTEATFLRPDR